MSGERMTLVQAYREGLREEMEGDERVIVLGEDIFKRGGNFAQVAGLGEAFGPGRVRDCPISEAAIVAAGVGSALNGMRPVVDLNFIDFGLSAMDEIVNQAAKLRYMWGRPVPLVIRGTAGIALFACQHNNSLDAAFAHTSGLAVVMPSTPADAMGLVKSAVRCDDPVVFLMHKRLTGARAVLDAGAHAPVRIGEAATRRSGGDVTLVAYGAMIGHCMRAAERLAEDGVEAEVIDLRSLFPIDYEAIIASVRRTGRLVVVTEEPPHGGIGADVAATLGEHAFEYLDAPIVRVQARDTPISHSPPSIEAVIPDAGRVEQAVRRSLADWPATR